VSLYVCPEDADPYCGVMTAIIERAGDDLLWRDMATSSFDSRTERWIHDSTHLQAWRLLGFPTAEYWRAIPARPR
jgi:hypothetical protein